MKLNIDKANKWTLILVLSVTFVLFALWFVFDSREPYDGSEVQGGVVLFFVAMCTIVIASIGFSIAAKIMQRIGCISYIAFISSLLAIISVFSIVSAIVLGAVGFGFSPKDLLRLSAIQFVFLLLACLPLSLFWWVIGKKNT